MVKKNNEIYGIIYNLIYKTGMDVDDLEELSIKTMKKYYNALNFLS